MKNPNKLLNCPYCWHQAPYKDYIVKKKADTHWVRCKCPDCGQGINPVLLYDLSVKEKAAYTAASIKLYRSPHIRFIDRMDFPKLMKRLGSDAETYWLYYTTIRDSPEIWEKVLESLEWKLYHKKWTQKTLIFTGEDKEDD